MEHDIPLLGGTWGTHLERKNARWHWVKSWSDIMRDPITFSPRSVKGPDQVVLAKYVWSWGRCNSLQHDSYTCQIFPGTRPFPTQRPIEPNNFIGAISVSNGTYLTPCPKLCRPKLHQHWTYCWVIYFVPLINNLDTTQIKRIIYIQVYFKHQSIGIQILLIDFYQLSLKGLSTAVCPPVCPSVCYLRN